MSLYKQRLNVNGSLSRYKARLVANGRGQQEGIEFDETFRPVVKPATIRTVMPFFVVTFQKRFICINQLAFEIHSTLIMFAFLRISIWCETGPRA